MRGRVAQLVSQERAAWCDIIRLELWKGAKTTFDLETLRQMDEQIPRLPINTQVWDKACQIAQTLRATGNPLPTSDILIFACAKTHEAEIESVDKHFDLLKNLSP